MDSQGCRGRASRWARRIGHVEDGHAGKWGERQRADQYQHQRQAPHEGEERDQIPCDKLDLSGASAAKARDERAKQVRQHVDLKEADESRREDTERLDGIPEDEAREDARANAPEDPNKESILLLIRVGHCCSGWELRSLAVECSAPTAQHPTLPSQADDY